MTKRGLIPASRLFALCMACAAMNQAVSGDAPSENDLKAAYLFKFAKFVEWPNGAFSNAESPIVIGILGDDPFGRKFDEGIKGKTAQERTVVIKRIRSAEAAAGCHILFISSSEESQMEEILEALKDRNILTAGETDRFNRQGGIVRFYVQGRHVLFEINPSAAKRAGLKINAELLDLGRPRKGAQ